MNSAVILFRQSLAEENEFSVANKHFFVVEQRSAIPYNSLVIGRYSVLPYYQELEQDLGYSKLVNSYSQHRFVADLASWYPLFEDLTPKTWFSLEEFNDNISFSESRKSSFVLKGETNSRKQLWSTHMFAKTSVEVVDVYGRLLDDSLISHQNICIRLFENFKKYGTQINGMPVIKEFRIFVYRGSIVSKGFYWSNFIDEINPKPDSKEIPEDFLQDIINRVGDKINFWVMDVAQREDGEWRLIELGDAQMAGLSCNEPEEFYKNLYTIVEGEDERYKF